MLIILDANILVSDFLFRGHEARTFFENLRYLGYTAYIPEVAFREAVNKYSEILSKSQKEYSRLGLELIFPFEQDDQSPIDVKYERYLEQFISRNHLKRLEYPKVGHEEIAMRALNVKRPFTSTTKGYRDTLIWFSTIELMRQSSQKVALLTADNGFYEDNKLHSDLVADLDASGASRDQLVLYKAYRDFYLAEIKPHLETAKESFFLDLVSPESKILNLINFLENEFSEFVHNSDLSRYDLEFPDAYENPTFFGIEKVVNVDFDSISAQKLPEGNRYLINYTAEVWVNVDFFVFRYPAYDTSDFDILDPDWNDDYVWAGKSILCDLTIELTLDTDAKKAESAQIVDLTRLDHFR